MLVDKIPDLFWKEMQESGFAAARWVSAWICHPAEVKGGSSLFWVKGQKWSLWKYFQRYNMGSSNLWSESCSVWTSGLSQTKGLGFCWYSIPSRSLERDPTVPGCTQPFLASPPRHMYAQMHARRNTVAKGWECQVQSGLKNLQMFQIKMLP